MKLTQGSFHQGDIRFGESAGKQCTCCSLFSIAFSIIKSPGYWDTKDLDFILENGDSIYKGLGKHTYLMFSDLPREIFVLNSTFVFEFCENKYGLLSYQSVCGSFINKKIQSDVDGFLLIIKGLCISVTWSKRFFFLYDSHSKDLLGKSSPDGTAIVLKFNSKKVLETYIIKNYLNESDVNIQYEIQYIKVVNENKRIISESYCALRETNRKSCLKEKERKAGFKEKERKAGLKEKQRKAGLKEKERKAGLKEKERKAGPDEREKSRKRNATQSARLQSRERIAKKRKTIDSLSRVSAFKTAVKEGPYYICVVCNRCLYRKTVKLLQTNLDKYDVDLSQILTTVKSFDSNFYICITCHQYLLKKKMPCQAVHNDLFLDEIPEVIDILNRLEKVLISKRILFKKITIMPKGQQPKIRGAICNIPIQTSAVTNCLPRETDDDVLFVKLKRKIIFTGHVYFESVRPNIVEAALNYLKISNPFYSNILINIDNINNELLSISDTDAMVNQDEYPLEIDNNENLEEENPLDSECVRSDEMCTIPNIYHNDCNILEMAPGENKKPLPFFNDDFCEEQAFPFLFPKGKFGYKVQRAIPLSPSKYFNQRLLNYTQRFSSNSDYIFFAQYVMQQINLFSQINIATCKVKGSMNAGQFNNNFKETIRALICEDKGYMFMKSVKGTPAYWKVFLHDVLAMVKQKGLPTFFLTLSCADLRWVELIDIIAKLNQIDVTVNEEMSYFKKCELLNQNPVLTARHFQFRVEIFFKEIILHKNGPFGCIDSYAIKVEFQVRGSPHIHSFIWVKDAPILSSETKEEYIAFVDSIIRADLPDETSEPELFELVSQYQTHSHSRTCRKFKNTPCRFHYGRFFTDRTICAEPLPDHLDSEEKKSILIERSRILSQVKEFIDEFLDPKKSSFKSDATIQSILDLLNISEEDYYRALSTSPDEDFQIHLRRPPNSCFINNYFAIGLEAWEANLDIQPVFNYFKAISYMCSYFSKCETESSVAMKKALEESQNDDFKERMKKVAISFLSHRQCSVQEAAYQVLSGLWLRKTFPVVTFANTNLPDKRYRICKSEEELKELPENSTDIFKRNNLDRYIDRPNKTFQGGKYSVLDDFCYAQFLAYYYLDTKPQLDENDSQPEVLVDDDDTQENSYPKLVPLMSSKEKMRCRNVKKIIRYHTPNGQINLEGYSHHLLMLFYPFRNEAELICENDQTYTTKLNEPHILSIVNQNKANFEPWGDLVELSLRQFLFQPRTDTFAQQENDDVNDECQLGDLDDEIENVDFEVNQSTSATPSRSQLNLNILTDDEINRLISTLNVKQREVFDVIISWARKTTISMSSKDTIDIEPLQIFITGGAGTGKSHLIKTVFAALTKTLSYKSESAGKSKVLLLAPTGVAAVNIAGTTIHSALGIPIDCRGLQVPKLSNKRRCSLRLEFEDLKAIIIDEISMVSNKLLLHIHQRLLDIFGYTNNCSKPFAGISIIVVGDLYQLPPVLQRPVFADYFNELYNLYHLWRKFKMCELTETMRQKGDLTLINLLNNVREGNLIEQDVEILKGRFIDKESENYPLEALHIFAENEPARLHNTLMLEKLQHLPVILSAIDQVPNGVPTNVYDKILDLQPSRTNGLSFRLTVKVGAKVMLTNNIDVADKLINGQIGTRVHFKYQNERVDTIYVKFENPNIGANMKLGDSLSTRYDAVPIQRITAEIKTHSKKEAAPVIKRTQFPIVLSWACTVHKVQGLSLNKIVISFDLHKQKSFNPGQIYVALSRVTSLEGLFLIGTFKKTAVVVDERAKLEYQRLRNYPFQIGQFEKQTPNELSVVLCNVRSLKKHLSDIKADKKFTESDIILCTETQIAKNENTEISIEGFDSIFHNCDHKYSSTAIFYKQSMKVTEIFKLDGILIVEIHAFSNENICLKVLLCYRNNEWATRDFYGLINYLSISYNLDIILGDFNVKPNEELAQNLGNYSQMVTEPTHLDGSTLDHVYVSNELLRNYNFDICVRHIFFTDHEMVRIGMCYKENV